MNYTHVTDPDQRDQCQYVYQLPDGSMRRCPDDGEYMIGKTIFLCGDHMPEKFRNPKTDKAHVSVDVSNQLLALFEKRNYLSHDDIRLEIRELFSRQYLYAVIHALRKEHIIKSVSGMGYRYIGKKAV